MDSYTHRGGSQVTRKEAEEIFPNDFHAGMEIFGNPKISLYMPMWRIIKGDEECIRCAHPIHGITNHPTVHCGKIANVVTTDGNPKVGLCEQHQPNERFIQSK